MEAKPLTKERRAEIESMWQMLLDAQTLTLYLCDVRDLLAAEQYWREAVKNTNQPHDDGRGYTLCPVCDAWYSFDDHAPDCAWVRARE